MDIAEFQLLMRDLYFDNDRARGVHRTALWLTEELGELTAHLKEPVETLMNGEIQAKIGEEMADI